MEISNLRPICAVCNNGLGSTNMIDWILFYIINMEEIKEIIGEEIDHSNELLINFLYYKTII